MSVKTITPEGLWQTMQSGRVVDLIDVRTPAEYESVHVEQARPVPLDSLDPKAVMASRRNSNGEPVYIICKGGTRSEQACRKFLAAGFENVVSVAGGTAGWEQAGLPVIRGRSALPLDRQIQLAAGSLILSGVLLGVFVSAWWYILPAFVGSGLTMAGLTGFCPMAIFLAKMPWNRAVRGATSCCAR